MPDVGHKTTAEKNSKEITKMAIKVNLESTKIPVDIGDLKFEIDVADDKYEIFINNFNIFLEEVDRLDEDNSEDVVQLKKFVEKIYDDMLGIGAYQQIYAKMPNISFVASTLVNIVTQLVEEVDKRMTPTSNLKTLPQKVTKIK